jgi:F0F1-type ATP synthase beta subunit
MSELDYTQEKLGDEFPERIGRLIQTQGRIIEIEYPNGNIPDCLSTVEIGHTEKGDTAKAVIIQRLEGGTIRAVSEIELDLAKSDQKVHESVERTSCVSIDAIKDVINRLSVRESGKRELIETGIKSIDLLCPISKNGRIG